MTAVAERPARILIVDDEPHNRKLLEVLLAPEGFALVTAATGEEALDFVAHEHPDLILLDVMMPGMDGFQVTSRLKSHRDTKAIPIIMVTALDDREARMRGLAAGAEDFLSKPVDRAELIARVRNLLCLKTANEDVARQAREIAAAHAAAEAATARLDRLQSITAALSDTVTQDDIADAILREALVALECDAAAIVVTGDDDTTMSLLRESGTLDPLMRSFADTTPGSRSPYAEAVANDAPIYLESFEEMVAVYPAYRDVNKGESRGAWMFLPLEIGGTAVGALAFGYGNRRTFTPLDRNFADTVSRYCAQALDRVRLRIAAAEALTEAREARMMAEHANSAKTLFLRSMSHELRTPLNAITGYTEILELGIRGAVNEGQVKDLGRIKRAAAFLLRLINDVLSVARLEGARPLNLIPIAVNPVLDEVEGLCALQAKAKGVKLTVSPLHCDVVVMADAERFPQILLNLITNAIKFSSAGSGIDVSCDCDAANMVRMHVKDTGVGVRVADLDRVFEPFVQIDRHLTKPGQQGVGLGLSISRELARAMHGDLTLESTEGVGSTFTLTLPIAPEGAVPHPAPAQSRPMEHARS